MLEAFEKELFLVELRKLDCVKRQCYLEAASWREKEKLVLKMIKDWKQITNKEK